MRAAIISDIHDHIENLYKTLSHPAAGICDVLLCCGDICSPFMIGLLHDKWKKPVHIVFGNNDGDRFLISQKVMDANKDRNENDQIIIHGEYLLKGRGIMKIGLPDSLSISMSHYPDIAYHLAETEEQQMIFYGHSHIPEIKTKGNNLMVNPGSVMGYIPSEKKHIGPSFAVADLQSFQAELIIPT
jgi:putative phosphoesterase